MNDPLETQLRTAVRKRADAVSSTEPPPIGTIERVVDRRRHRRRVATVGGSAVAVTIGLAGVVTLAGPATDTVPLSPADGGSAAPGSLIWRCTGILNDGTNDPSLYFEHCERTQRDWPVPTTVPMESASPSPTSVTRTTVFDGAFDDPVMAATASCTPGTGNGEECALIDTEQLVIAEADDTVTSLALRYRLSIDTLAAWNGWPDGVAHQLSPGDDVRVPPAGAFRLDVDQTHVVSAGQTIEMIAALYDIDAAEIASANGFADDEMTTLSAGDTLTIPARLDATNTWGTMQPQVDVSLPAAEQRYTIVVGDSLASIAERFGVTLQQLVNYNQFADGANAVILPGQEILIPPEAATTVP